MNNLPAISSQAMNILNNIRSHPIIEVTDEFSKKITIEDLKSEKILRKVFEEIIDFEKKIYYEPYKTFLDIIKPINDELDLREKTRKTSLGKYELKLKEKLNHDNENLDIQVMKSKTEFASSTTKEKAVASITDVLVFITCLIETGKASKIRVIFDKINQSELNRFCKEENITAFPGLNIEIIPDVRIR